MRDIRSACSWYNVLPDGKPTLYIPFGYDTPRRVPVISETFSIAFTGQYSGRNQTRHQGTHSPLASELAGISFFEQIGKKTAADPKKP